MMGPQVAYETALARYSHNKLKVETIKQSHDLDGGHTYKDIHIYDRQIYIQLDTYMQRQTHIQRHTCIHTYNEIHTHIQTT